MIVSEEALKRINELAAKAKESGLTEDEARERDALRKEYLEAFRASFKKQLENIDLVDDKGNVIQRVSDRKK